MSAENQLTAGLLQLHVPWELSAEFSNWYHGRSDVTGWAYTYNPDAACFEPESLQELADLQAAWPRIWADFEAWHYRQLAIDEAAELRWYGAA